MRKRARKRAVGACALACALALAIGVPAGAFAADNETTWAGPTTANSWAVPSASSDNTTVTSTNATPSYTVTVPTAVSYNKTNGNTITANVKGEIAAGYTVLVQAVKDNSADDPASDFTVLTLKDADNKEMELDITGTNQISWSREEVEQTGEVNGVTTVTGTNKTVASLTSGQDQKVGTYTGKIYYRVKYCAPSLTVTLDKTSENLATGKSATLTATVGTAPTGSSGKYTYKWTSSDKVTVAGSGTSCTVTNNSLGSGDTATVTCTVTDSVDNNIVGTATCTITGVASLTVTLDSNEVELAQGDTATLTPTVTGGSGSYTYSWKVVDEFNVETGTVTVDSDCKVTNVSLAPGSPVTITCTATDTEGASGTATCIVKGLLNVTITPDGMTLTAGDEDANHGTLAANSDGDFGDTSYSWTSSEPTNCTIASGTENSQTCTVYGIVKGTYTITCSAHDEMGNTHGSKTCTVTVK